MRSTVPCAGGLPVLLQAEPSVLRDWLGAPGRIWVSVGLLVFGGASYGAAMGSWRGMEQAVYTAIKLPVILIITAAGNVLLNGVLARLLGLGLSIRQTLEAVLAAMAIAAVILGALAPVVFFEVWNLPSMNTPGIDRGSTFNLMQLSQVLGIAFAGVAAHLRLHALLVSIAPNRSVAGRVMAAWLLGNLFLGSQLTWILRPFFGQPELPVEFLRPNAFESNFFEALFKGLRYLLQN